MDSENPFASLSDAKLLAELERLLEEFFTRREFEAETKVELIIHSVIAVREAAYARLGSSKEAHRLIRDFEQAYRDLVDARKRTAVTRAKFMVKLGH